MSKRFSATVHTNRAQFFQSYWSFFDHSETLADQGHIYLEIR